ncbi:sulfite exporter TauE/SafE family protein [Chelatococcus sp. SYSU_G07232]|uniref:Probable membrane transporter protein n=1 Tax=Chelatococcus albus TaxID=3047466 RepID=A0ABT7AF18_9HYPH|nr:sulfite exporter TauE/SafE family protein [Chelatococcus sp. SYSU_G07232]MDJ1157943.1 sulfite exporter TauE/SafE family protein [Chelatococcus sp. SYSU_G07232]
MLSGDLALYIALGFTAQLIDGALGMAYSLIATSALLALGTPPAFASASVHAAETVTTGLAGASHAWHRNIDWSVVGRLAPAGVIGGIIGAHVLTELPEGMVRIFVTFYLMAMTLSIVRCLLTGRTGNREILATVPIGLGSGFLDAIGGGGWGPLANSALIARGDRPRHSIGSVGLSEFFVTVAISATFVATLDPPNTGASWSG